MNILIASDKFKGSLSAQAVCQSIAEGIHLKNENIELIIQPMADGGDGTMQLLKELLGLEVITANTVDPLGRAISANYYSDGITAYIELAEASGITRLRTDELNVLDATTIGTGVLIDDAIRNGCKEIVLGLGGSCTNDAGLGIAHILGYKFLDKTNSEIIPCGANLLEIERITAKQSIGTCKLTLLCDVKNPLYGMNGAAFVYARQKGADDMQIEYLDKGLRHVSDLILDTCGLDISHIEGGGAAGGIAAGLIGLFQAKSLSGFDYLKEITGLEEKIRNADIVLSGEGKLDRQSLQGKVVGQILELCNDLGKNLIVIAGDSDLDDKEFIDSGIAEIYTVMDKAKDLTDAMTNTDKYLKMIGFELF